MHTILFKPENGFNLWFFICMSVLDNHILLITDVAISGKATHQDKILHFIVFCVSRSKCTTVP